MNLYSHACHLQSIRGLGCAHRRRALHGATLSMPAAASRSSSGRLADRRLSATRRLVGASALVDVLPGHPTGAPVGPAHAIEQRRTVAASQDSAGRALVAPLVHPAP